MGMSEELYTKSDQVGPKFKKHVTSLTDSASRTKIFLINTLMKSQKRFIDQAEKLDPGKQKEVLEKKLEKTSRELKILQELSEEEVITFALTTQRNLMAIAANKRITPLIRMKARIASHKPFSTHLAKVKRKENQSEDSESENDTEDQTSATLKKVTVNNQVVKMRNSVRRAKVHLIHKLTRHVKILRERKCNEKTKGKVERKIERFVKKIKCIQKLYIDDVSKFALSSAHDLKQISVDMKASMRTQALATLAIHKFIAEPVASFKRQYPDWEKTVPKILRQKKKKRKLKLEAHIDTKDIGKRLANKLSTDSENDSSEEEECEKDEISEEENKEESDYSKEESCEASSGSEEESQYEENNVKVNWMKIKQEESDEEGDHSKDESNETKEKKHTSEESEYSSSSEYQSDDDNQNSSNSISNDMTNKKYRKIAMKRKSTQLEGTQFKKLRTSDTNVLKKYNDSMKKGTTVNTLIKKVSEKKLNENKPKVVDPFFMTTKNEEYVTSQIPVDNKNNYSNLESKNENSYIRRTNKFSSFDTNKKWSKKENNWGQKRFINNKPLKTNFEKFSTKSTDKLIISTGNRKERRQALQRPFQEEKTEKLHPSWEAKKKLTSMAAFQGKKITFD